MTDRYLAGCLPHQTVGAVVVEHAEVVGRFDYVLISMIDSYEDVHRLPLVQSLKEAGQIEPVSETPFVLTGSAVVELARRHNLFTGFDEIWFLRHAVVKVAPPADVALVAPEQMTPDDVPERVVAWMEKNDCCLGLGDGDGLNFVAADARIAADLGLI